MNKKTTLIIMTVALIIASALVYVLVTPNKKSAFDVSTNATKDTNPSPTETTQPRATPASAGTYVDYTADLLAATSDTRLLFFYAPWCPQCRAVDDSIKTDGLPAGVTVFKVDYDSNQKLREKYGVTIQTTFVKIDNNGNKVKSYVAYAEPRFSSVQRELLP